MRIGEERAEQSVELFYEAPEQALVGISESIPVVFGDTLNLGEELLRESQTLNGSLTLVTGDQKLLPAQDVTVSLGRFSASTDSRGLYSIANVPLGTFAISVNVTGYVEYEKKLSTDPLVLSETDTDIKLFKTNVSGLVVAGNPLVDSKYDLAISAAPDVSFMRFASTSQNFSDGNCPVLGCLSRTFSITILMVIRPFTINSPMKINPSLVKYLN